MWRVKHTLAFCNIPLHLATVDKSRPKSQKRGNPQNLIPGKGRGPKKGAANAGRPRDEWKARLQAMASRDEVLDHVSTVLLAGPDHPFFAKALEYVTDHGYGKAASSLDLTTKGESLNPQRITINGTVIEF